MGTMQLDGVGAWIDPGEITGNIGYQAAAAMGIELDCQFCSLDQVYEETYDTSANVEINEPEVDSNDDMTPGENDSDRDASEDFDIPSKIEPSDELRIEPPKDANNYYRRNSNKLGRYSVAPPSDATVMAVKSEMASLIQRIPLAEGNTVAPGVAKSAESIMRTRPVHIAVDSKIDSKAQPIQSLLSREATQLASLVSSTEPISTEPISTEPISKEPIRRVGLSVSQAPNQIDRIIGLASDEKTEASPQAEISPESQDWDRNFSSFGRSFNRFRSESSRKN